MFTTLWHTLVTFFSRLFLAVLASGPIPKHVAFVMDGNRRFARLQNRQVVEGHQQGFESLKNVSRSHSIRCDGPTRELRC
jgi:ditrans,polycis-polyprenyl diphosphate synthase